MTDASWTNEIASYYRSSSVRHRLSEACGGQDGSPDSFSSWSLAAFGGARRRFEVDGGPVPFGNADFSSILDEGADLCRSLADRGGTLIVLDVDYVSPDNAIEAYSSPAMVFRRLEPVHQAVLQFFRAHGLEPRAIGTGRGYHYSLRAPLGSAFRSKLVAIGSAGVRTLPRVRPPQLSPMTVLDMEHAHEGAGRLLEHIAHRLMHRLRGATEVPVTLADVPPPGRGPFICLDLSAHGDPLFTRHIRCAFSTNQKAGIMELPGVPPFTVALSRRDEPLAMFLSARRDPTGATCWAAMGRATIPDVSEAGTLLMDYENGAVARFHHEFDSGPAELSSSWPTRQDEFEVADLPACMSTPFANPNPLLLRPSCLRSVALGMLGLGESPRAIADAVSVVYREEHGWQPPFSHYDAARRANFYVRVLCGALADGLDSAAQFSCATQATRNLCFPGRCSQPARTLFASLGTLAQLRAQR